MSSLLRRLAIRTMKRAGCTRNKWIIVKGKPVSVKRDGEITDADDNPIGRDWPKLIPSRFKISNPKAKDLLSRTRNRRVDHRTPRAMRKCKPNKKMLAKWADRGDQ